MSSDKSHKDPFECDDDEDVPNESASSINSDEQELIESSENVPMDDIELLLLSLTIHFMFFVPSPPIIPLTFISRDIFFGTKCLEMFFVLRRRKKQKRVWNMNDIEDLTFL